jgi:hypothetical protein
MAGLAFVAPGAVKAMPTVQPKSTRPAAELPVGCVRPRLPLQFLLLIPFALGVLLAAGAFGSSLVFANLPSQKENSNYSSDTNLNYWVETFVEETTIPTGLMAVSQTVGSPTNLPGGTASFALQTTTTAGHAAITFEFTEQTNVSTNKEVEIRFTIGEITGSAASVTAYIKTQGGPPGAPVTYTFYYDEGASATYTTNFLVQADNQQSFQCTAVGSCP